MIAAESHRAEILYHAAWGIELPGCNFIPKIIPEIGAATLHTLKSKFKESFNVLKRAGFTDYDATISPFQGSLGRTPKTQVSEFRGKNGDYRLEAVFHHSAEAPM